MSRSLSRTVACAFMLTAAGFSSPGMTQLPAPIYPSREAWTSASPAELGLDPALLAEARAYAEGPADAPRLGAGMIVRRGYKVYEWGDTLYRYHVFSVTKGIGAILLGVAEKEFGLTLDTRAQTIYPAFGTNPPSNDPDWLDDVTIEQLATHAAGFEDVSSAPRFEHQPGTKWLYTDGGANWLADTLTVRFGADLREVLTKEVLSPLGISRGDSGSGDLTWRDVLNKNSEPSIGGIPRRDLNAGIALNVDSMARLGLLLERDGAWEGNPILDPAFVQRLRTPAPSIAGLQAVDSNGNPDPDFPDVTAHYGLLWFNNADGAIANVPTDTYWAWGLGDHLIVVIPSLHLVIARTSGKVEEDQGASQPLPWARATPCNAGAWCGRYDVLAPFLQPIVQAVLNKPTVTLTSSASSVSAGGTATLTWMTTDADACTASNGWAGNKAPSGSETVTVAQTTTYALECSGMGGTAQSSVSITVTAAPPPDDGGGGALQGWLLGALLLFGAARRSTRFLVRRTRAAL